MRRAEWTGRVVVYNLYRGGAVCAWCLAVLVSCVAVLYTCYVLFSVQHVHDGSCPLKT